MPKTVLLVDDDRMLRKCLDDMLSSHGGFVVHTAENGADALRKVEGGLAFDVLLTDKDMPEMRGDALVAELRTRGFRQFMILMTGDVRANASYPGVDLLVAKPFSIIELFDVIANAEPRAPLP